MRRQKRYKVPQRREIGKSHVYPYLMGKSSQNCLKRHTCGQTPERRQYGSPMTFRAVLSTGRTIDSWDTVIRLNSYRLLKHFKVSISSLFVCQSKCTKALNEKTISEIYQIQAFVLF